MNFYNHILHKLALLNQKSRQEGNVLDVRRNIQTALKIFITRLPVHMRTVLCALKPQTMEEAIHELSQSGFLNEENNKYSHQNWQPKTNHQKKNNNNWQPRVYIPQGEQKMWQQGTIYRQQNNQQPKPEPMDTSTIQTGRQNHHRQSTIKPECNCKSFDFNYINDVEDRQGYEGYEPGNFPVTASPPKDPRNSDFPMFY